MLRILFTFRLVIVTLMWGVTHQTAMGQESPQPPAAKVENSHTAEDSITVFPVIIKPGEKLIADLPERIAAVVGVMLEKAGIENVELGKPRFDSPATDDARQIADEFAKHVREASITTRYALYAEIHGTPQTGPQKIFTIVVDKQGKVILAERDDDKTYARVSDVRPKDPMTCSLFVAKRVQDRLKVTPSANKDARPGKMAEYWRKQSGLPPQSELDAIATRCQEMVKQVGKARCAVFPIRIRSETDAESAGALAAALNDVQACRAVVADADPKLNIEGDPNEQKMLWDTARGLQKFVKANRPETDYVLYADYAIHHGPAGQSQVRYVHVIVCDRQGDWVVVDFQNSHHPDFQSVAPESKEDCQRLVIKRVQRLLAESGVR